MVHLQFDSRGFEAIGDFFENLGFNGTRRKCSCIAPPVWVDGFDRHCVLEQNKFAFESDKKFYSHRTCIALTQTELRFCENMEGHINSLDSSSENCSGTKVHLHCAMPFHIWKRMLLFKPTQNNSMTRYVWAYSECIQVKGIQVLSSRTTAVWISPVDRTFE